METDPRLFSILEITMAYGPWIALGLILLVVWAAVRSTTTRR